MNINGSVSRVPLVSHVQVSFKPLGNLRLNLRLNWKAIALSSLFLLFALFLSFCFTPAAFADVAKDAAKNIAKPIHWSYGGSDNPERWGKLSPDFALCEQGHGQSPINIQDAVRDRPLPIVFDYQPSPLEVVNNGHTIQVNYAQGSSISIGDEKFSLLQFHFHTPSEHFIKNDAFPLELHLVHRSESGQLAVVGVMLEQGKANPLIAKIWEQIPEVGKSSSLKDRLINAQDLLPKNRSYYSYEGSLTTPPCSEGVKWNVMTEPMTVSAEQIDKFTSIYQVDARPVQAVYDRKVYLHPAL